MSLILHYGCSPVPLSLDSFNNFWDEWSDEDTGIPDGSYTLGCRRRHLETRSRSGRRCDPSFTVVVRQQVFRKESTFAGGGAGWSSLLRITCGGPKMEVE